MKKITYSISLMLGVFMFIPFFAFAQESEQVIVPVSVSEESSLQGGSHSGRGNKRPMDKMRMEHRERMEDDTMRHEGKNSRTPGILKGIKGERYGAEHKNKENRKHMSDVRQLANQRYVVVIAKMENIHTRLESRLGEMKTAGIDTTEALKALTDSKSALVEAKSYKAKIEALMQSVTDESSKEAIKTEAKGYYESLRASLKKAHASLKETMRITKSLQPKNEDSQDDAQPTASVAPTSPVTQ
jgi:hypothetical protein